MDLNAAFAEAARRRAARTKAVRRQEEPTLAQQAIVQESSPQQRVIELGEANDISIPEPPSPSSTHPSGSLFAIAPDAGLDKKPHSTALVHRAAGALVDQYQPQDTFYNPSSGSAPAEWINNRSVNNATTINNNYNINYNSASDPTTSTTPAPKQESHAPDRSNSSCESMPETTRGVVQHVIQHILSFLGFVQALVFNKPVLTAILSAFSIVYIVVRFFDAIAFYCDLALGHGQFGALIGAQLGLVSIGSSWLANAHSSSHGQPEQPSSTSSATLSFRRVVPTAETDVIPLFWESWLHGVVLDAGQREDFEISKEISEAHRTFNREFIDQVERDANSQYQQLMALRSEIAEAISAHEAALARPWWKWSRKLDTSPERFRQRLLVTIEALLKSRLQNRKSIKDLVGDNTQGRGICKSQQPKSGLLTGLSWSSQASNAASEMICFSQKRTNERWRDIREPIRDFIRFLDEMYSQLINTKQAYQDIALKVDAVVRQLEKFAKLG